MAETRGGDSTTRQDRAELDTQVKQHQSEYTNVCFACLFDVSLFLVLTPLLYYLLLGNLHFL